MQKGQKIYFTQYSRGEGYGQFQETEITKVGRNKTFQTKNEKNVFFQDSSNADNRGWIDAHYSNNHCRYFESVEQGNEFFEARKLRSKILDLERSGKLDELSIKQLRKICETFE